MTQFVLPGPNIPKSFEHIPFNLGDKCWLAKPDNQSIEVVVAGYVTSAVSGYTMAFFNTPQGVPCGGKTVWIDAMYERGLIPPQRLFHTKVIADYSAFLWDEFMAKVTCTMYGSKQYMKS